MYCFNFNQDYATRPIYSYVNTFKLNFKSFVCCKFFAACKPIIVSIFMSNSRNNIFQIWIYFTYLLPRVDVRQADGRKNICRIIITTWWKHVVPTLFPYPFFSLPLFQSLSVVSGIRVAKRNNDWFISSIFTQYYQPLNLDIHTTTFIPEGVAEASQKFFQNVTFIKAISMKIICRHDGSAYRHRWVSGITSINFSVAFYDVYWRKKKKNSTSPFLPWLS
jgi:hypothetical protein